MLLGLSIAGLILLAGAFVLVFRYQKQRRIQWKRETELKTELIRSELSLKLQNERLRISRDLHDNLGAELTIVGAPFLEGPIFLLPWKNDPPWKRSHKISGRQWRYCGKVSGRSGMSSFPS
ncbi:MAG: hypothetical protein IPK21_05650 [Haliscomenobacter sp.]|nr:hypothetical protein [Haliscomenobacter sp.]